MRAQEKDFDADWQCGKERVSDVVSNKDASAELCELMDVFPTWYR